MLEVQLAAPWAEWREAGTGITSEDAARIRVELAKEEARQAPAPPEPIRPAAMGQPDTVLLASHSYVVIGTNVPGPKYAYDIGSVHKTCLLYTSPSPRD